MQTIRGRLTVWYSAALVLTLAAFAIVLYVARRRASYDDLDQRIRSEAELSAAILGESYRARGALVTYDSTGKPALVADIKAVLEAVPDYLLITAQDGEILYSSSNASLTYQQVVQLRRLMTPPLSGRTGGTVRLEPDGPELRYVAHIVSGAGPRFGSLLVAADVRTAELAVAQLLSTLVLIVPIGLIAAILVGSWIARRALEPVDRIISEVREITDGRGLHRRLAEPMVKDELGRLAETLNQMMTAGTELRRPAPLHGGREPRAENAAHGVAGWCRAGAHDVGTAPGYARHARRDAAGDQAHDRARGRAAHARPGGRGHRAPAPRAGGPAGDRRGSARDGRAARRASGSANGARDAAGAGDRARGCEPHPPADPQPRHQRGEVYPVGRQRPDAARAVGRPRHSERRRYRDRHRGGRLAPHLRSFLAGRLGAHPHRRAPGGGAGPRHLQVYRRSARRDRKSV